MNFQKTTGGCGGVGGVKLTLPVILRLNEWSFHKKNWVGSTGVFIMEWNIYDAAFL